MKSLFQIQTAQDSTHKEAVPNVPEDSILITIELVKLSVFFVKIIIRIMVDALPAIPDSNLPTVNVLSE